MADNTAINASGIHSESKIGLMPHNFIPIAFEDAKRAEVRFWDKVAKGPTCWAWTASSNNRRQGYGSFRLVSDHNVLAHRVAWTLANGSIPAGAEVLHACDNPPCVRPSHLFLGSQQDNALDMVGKGRHARCAFPGERNPRARLTAEQVASIRDAIGLNVKQRDLARLYNVSEATISYIKHEKRWAA